MHVLNYEKHRKKMIQYPKSENSEGAENQIGADEGKQLVIEKTGEFHTETRN